MPHLDIWTTSEIFAAVKLALFLRDNPDANKTALLNELTIKLDRVPPARADYVNEKLASGKTIGAKPKINGAPERKVWNVSAILMDAGMNAIPGFNYFGGFNYQFAECDAVAVALGISTIEFIEHVNIGRAEFAARARAGEFTDSINKKLIERAKHPITMDHVNAANAELDNAEKYNRKASRSVQLKTEV